MASIIAVYLWQQQTFWCLSRYPKWVHALFYKWIIGVVCGLLQLKRLNELTCKHSKWTPRADSTGHFWTNPWHWLDIPSVSLFMSINTLFIFACQRIVCSRLNIIDRTKWRICLKGLRHSVTDLSPIHSFSTHSLDVSVREVAHDKASTLPWGRWRTVFSVCVQLFLL